MVRQRFRIVAKDNCLLYHRKICSVKKSVMPYRGESQLQRETITADANVATAITDRKLKFDFVLSPHSSGIVSRRTTLARVLNPQ